MSKLRKKIVVPISLTLTGCLVVAAFVLNDSLTKVDANVAFNGISDIVSSHGKDKPFNIVEVVPDKKMASIGSESSSGISSSITRLSMMKFWRSMVFFPI